ncbi:hypothetical protein OCAE111667_06090 [Occultella aeris]|uniref:Uncharacterized protein n=1 Tax=Occultella aeris TaxID=2761496 RepID=A0A7M4DLP6_9MICO|nr:hypothetical protein [Occultella aeris]VZO38218.1 hypothetical protein HALOF300_03063 [Occultella aeris]
MSQRFNAPPGWQVPPNFTPPEGWQPDPAWPPAPAGWNYWVDDAAGSAAGMTGQNPGYGAPLGQNPAYGPGSSPAYGPGSSAPAGASPYGASGTASAALAQEEVKKARNSALIGFGILAAAVLVFAISFGIAASSSTGGRYYFPWYFMLAGLIVGIRGLVAYNKAKKAASFTAGGNFDPTAYSGSAGSVTPPGVTPPGGYPAPGSDSGPRPGEYRP